MKLVMLLITSLTMPLLMSCALPTAPAAPADDAAPAAPTPAPADPSASATATTSAPPTAELPSSGASKLYTSPPEMIIDPDAKYKATIRTNRGNITIELFPSEAPKTVNNFVFLAREGFYDGIIFHRVIPDFMIQGGDPTGTGTSGPGYQFEDEIVSALVFDRPGRLAMANAGPNTNGSQFFITVAPTPHLNGNHTIFGEVVDGQNVADAISVAATGRGNKPLQPVIIETIEITEQESR